MYKIEITAETLAELAGKALSLAAKLNTGTATESAPVVVEAAPVDPTPAPKSAPAAEETESQPTPPEPAPAPSASASELNFDTDVAPIVLQVVKDKGKPVVQEILEQFGVERASTLDPSRWPELVAQLKGAL
jgi:hypothetical protein